MSERVFCVPAEMVAVAAKGRPFWIPAPPDNTGGLLERFLDLGVFKPRDEVERDESWRQVIPYLILRNPEGGYFTYRRLPASGEPRLRDLHSIGVGGHINDEHLVSLDILTPGLRPNLIADGLHRELNEELTLPETDGKSLGGLRLHGFLSLDETPVDRVHVGIVARADIGPEYLDGCDVRERDKLKAVGWLSPAELRAMSRNQAFEGWSRTLIAHGLP